MYDASDTMVDELNDINKGVGEVSNAITDSAQTSIDAVLDSAYSIGQTIVIAIGCMTIAISLTQVKKDRPFN